MGIKSKHGNGKLHGIITGINIKNIFAILKVKDEEKDIFMGKRILG